MTTLKESLLEILSAVPNMTIGQMGEVIGELSVAVATLELAAERSATKLDASSLRDIRDEHMIAELRVSLQEQTAVAERTVRENVRLKQQLTDALAEVAELNARLEEIKEEAFERSL